MTAPDFESLRPDWRPQWILGSGRDLLLFIATPLLIIPAVMAAQRGLSIAEIGIYVGAFGAIGHHLPGMMRAYGDRELFARFRMRFTVAPVFLVAVCVYCTLFYSAPLTFVVALWGTWHGLAQVYGFARIYDAKLARPSWLTMRLDLWLCLAWFGAGVLYSPGRSADLLTTFYGAGGPIFSPLVLGALRWGWAAATLAVTVVFIANAIREWRSGRPCSPAKLLLFVSSFSFWWLCMVAIDDIILGVAAFEVFHDIQYLAIVWGYNRRRVETGHNLSGFMRFLFRRSGVLVGVYVGLVFAYGSTNLLAHSIDQYAVRNVLLGLLTASALLHFYFDAFIWSVRDAQTRESLGLGAEGAVATVRASVSNLGPQAAKWGLFVLPLIALSVAGSGELAPQVERLGAVVETVPLSADAHAKFARALDAEGRHREAILELQEAVTLQPDFAEAHADLATVYLTRKQYKASEAAFAEALRLAPRLAAAREGLGRVLLAREEMDAAAREFELALAIDPGSAKAEYFLGVTHLASDRVDVAATHFDRALELDRGELVGTRGAMMVFLRLASAYEEAGRPADAARWRAVAALPPETRSGD